MNKTEKISSQFSRAVMNMPFFTVENLSILHGNNNYLKILSSRKKLKNELFRLKKGMYVSAHYINELKIKGVFDEYREFIAAKIYEPSYLSAEYVLDEYGILSEAYYGYSLVTTRKTNKINNDLGNFYYHHIKDDLFTGFKVDKKAGFLIFKASAAKALFDFLYFRKNYLINKESVKELRLNWEKLKNRDKKEFKKYIKEEGSKKMLDIYNWLTSL